MHDTTEDAKKSAFRLRRSINITRHPAGKNGYLAQGVPFLNLARRAVPDEEKPSRPGGLEGLGRAAPERRCSRNYMWSIMTWPKPEQLTCVAPSIRRAKS